MEVLVVGAHGQTAIKVVELLIEKDHNVRAMVRDAAQAGELEKRGAEAVIADLEQDIEFAVEGCDAVIFAAGSGADTGEDKTWAVDRDGAIKVIEACERNAVERFVMLSALGADAPEKAQEAMAPYMKAKAEADQRLQKSKLNYTIIRPGMLNDDPESLHIIAREHLKDKKGQISRSDVAYTIAETLENPNAYRKTFEVIGGGHDAIAEAIRKL